MDHILYQIVKIFLSISKKKQGEDIGPSVQIHVNKIENRVTFEIKNGYSLDLLTPETMKTPKTK